MLSYEQAIELFPTLSHEAYNVWAAASAKADEALRAYEEADEAVVAAFRRQAPRAERQALMAARDEAEEAHARACEARDAVTPQ
jgi:hypothetical protein